VRGRVTEHYFSSTMKFIPITAEETTTARVRESELIRGVCEAMLALYPNGKPVFPWIGYLAEEEDVLVGTCAFKTPPNTEGVEIAYFTFPGHEGRGVATRMTAHLIEIAASRGVPVRAQTLPEENASTRILGKFGFQFAGTAQDPDPDVGEVWEWKRP
jgi:ribosomal-protein-alanine N-acetyltransferase